MKTLTQIGTEVGEWSLRNFGAQQSKVDPDLFLGSIAPLLGIVEELGELCGAKTYEDRRDAVGDVGIYLCDYLHREGLSASLLETHETATGDAHLVLKHLGGLCHATLKRHQGIRGFGSLPKYQRERDRALIGFLATFRAWTAVINCPFDECLRETWDKVSSRDWVKDPQGKSAT